MLFEIHLFPRSVKDRYFAVTICNKKPNVQIKSMKAEKRINNSICLSSLATITTVPTSFEQNLKEDIGNQWKETKKHENQNTQVGTS